MAANDKIWTGGAATQAQVDTITPAGVVNADSWAFTLTDDKGQAHTITVVSTATATVKEVCDLMTAAAAASFDQEWAKITVADDDTALTFTADTAGVPFYLTLVVTGTGTFTSVHTTASKGPSDYNVVENWAEGAAPLADTTIYVRGSADDILYGLHTSSVSAVSAAQSNALTLQESVLIEGIKVEPGCSTGIGSDHAYLHLDCKTICSLKGSGIIWLHVDNMTGTLLIEQSASGGGDGTYGVNLRVDEGTDATAIACNLTSGATVGVAAQPGATAADDGDATSISINGGEVHLGVHQIPTITTDGSATIYNDTAFTTLTEYAGTFYNQGSATITTANVQGNATFVGNSTGTITTLHVKESATADFSQDLQAKTVTNANVYGSGTIKDPNGIVTFTNGIDVHDTNLDTVTLDLAPNKTWTQSAI